MGGIHLPGLTDDAKWALDYLSKDVREFGDKAGESAISTGALEQYKAEIGGTDPLTALGREYWDDYYSVLAWQAYDSLKTPLRAKLPGREELMELLFRQVFMPAMADRVAKGE